MQIFLCWSGKASHAIAEALHAFLGDSIQQLKPFLSSEDIRKGGRWRDEIGQQLASCNFGILCFTKDNLNSRWMLFEAGALSKLPKSGVTALLAGIQPTDLLEPLNQFQNTRISRTDIFKLIADINRLLPEDSRLDSDRLKRIFERDWPALENKLTAALALKDVEPSPVTKRDSDSMIAETLELVREIKRGVDVSKLAATLTTTAGNQFGTRGLGLGAANTLLYSTIASGLGTPLSAADLTGIINNPAGPVPAMILANPVGAVPGLTITPASAVSVVAPTDLAPPKAKKPPE
jgi:TIR domain